MSDFDLNNHQSDGSGLQPHGDYGAGQDFGNEMLQAGPQPMSAMAVVGFVSSVLVCCPVISPLLGIIFSVVGIVQTAGGKRRGRVLAFLGLIIALFVCTPAQIFLGAKSVDFFKGHIQMQLALSQMFASDAAGMQEHVDVLYGMASADFVARVDKPALVAWLAEHHQKLGTMQSVDSQMQAAEVPGNQDAAKMYLNMRFPDGSAMIGVVVSYGSWMKPVIEDIHIDDDSALEALGGGGILPGTAVQDEIEDTTKND